MTLCAPWGILNSDYSQTEVDDADGLDVIEKGSFVVIVSRNDITTKVFIPCGGPDAETDTVPSWVEDTKITDICPIDIKKVQ